MSRRNLLTRVTAAVASIATALALMPAAQAQSLPVPTPVAELSAQAQSVPVPTPVAELSAQTPFQAVAAAPAPAAPAAWTADSVEGRLLSATERNLSDMGHRADPQAWDIAAQWAGQALAGQVEFLAGVGRGVTHTDVGDGNIYRLSVAEAEARIQWLNREANTSQQSYRFGVASARQGDTVYLVEYFLH
ncbi:hypothetical protein [Corynebacterium guangdongense]|uniref:SCP domain-containing protein n=1 Tax=Corynebacterium guangdongense TaxID=1783348 RepID=A0ABU1ZVS7_9CORY|nr:hypothetical protein [Corynebacterium guangdongense]MDR7328865.1 hypothetical protein [Corynebacterium guangdongense]WJZ17440.1 hypothetical protein CGUA_04250 [Corynebacterium guangdongense]